MNKAQWSVLGIGMIILGSILLVMSPFCGYQILYGSDQALTNCLIRRYSFGIPGLIISGLGIIFTWVAFAGDKK